MQEDREKSAQFVLSFEFERGTIRLRGGGLFTPREEAVNSWVVSRPAFYRILDTQCRVLYQTQDDHFVHVTCESCSRTAGSPLWTTDGPPIGAVVSPKFAAEFLLQNQFPVPPELRNLLVSESEPENATGAPLVCRPPEYWQTNWRRFRPAATSVQAVNFMATADSITNLAVRFVQFLRDGNEPDVRRSSVAGQLCMELSARHPVALSLWEEDGVPPAVVELLEWEWPAPLRPVQMLLKQLRAACEPELSCLCAAVFEPAETPDGPNEAELGRAEADLQVRLPLIESLVVGLRQALREANRKDEPTRDAQVGTEPVPNDPPTEERERLLAKINALAERARMAYLSYEYAASRLAAEPGRSRVTDPEAYAWLKEHGYEEYALPDYETWARYVRGARRPLELQKNQPRHGREGGSIRKADDL